MLCAKIIFENKLILQLREKRASNALWIPPRYTLSILEEGAGSRARTLLAWHRGPGSVSKEPSTPETSRRFKTLEDASIRRKRKRYNVNSCRYCPEGAQ